MNKFFLLVSTLMMSAGLMAQSSYKVDAAHSSVNFKVKHLGITFVSGKFEKFDGGIIGDVNNMEQATVFFNVETASINTGVEARDKHLRSADFFDVEKFTAMSFESTSIEKVDNENYKLNGILQIKDASKPVTFDVKYGGAVKDRNGIETIGFIAKNTINRFDFNVSYDPELTSIGKDVSITLYLEFKNAADKPAQQ